MRSVLLVLISVILSLAVFHFSNAEKVVSVKSETAFDRVMRTGVIRCGYQPYAPALIKDPNTGKMSGIFYEITDEVGRRLGLKIDWAEEVGYGVIAEGFNTHRYDIFCNTVWPTAERSREASFTIPLYYSPVGVAARVDDHRFDSDMMAKLNSPDVIFAIKDGDISDSFQKDQFPLAKTIGIPQLSDTSQLVDDVATGKADVTINEPSLLLEYSKANPNKVRNIAAKNPIRVSPNTYMLPKNEYQFKMMWDTALTELHNNGFIAKTVAKYDQNNVFLPVQKPYELPVTRE